MGAGTGSTGNAIADLILEKVAPELREQAESYVRQRVDVAIAEGRARLQAEAQNYGALVEKAVDSVIARPVPGEVVLDATQDAKADARQRSWRTLVQGGLATVIVSVGGGVGQAIAAPGFDLLSRASLGTAAAAGGTAAIAELLSYVQRFVQPPKSPQ